MCSTSVVSPAARRCEAESWRSTGDWRRHAIHVGGRVDRDVAALDGASEDRPRRYQRAVDGGGVELSGGESVWEVQHVPPLYFWQAERAELGEDVVAERR
jgi:hypothetical protein